MFRHSLIAVAVVATVCGFVSSVHALTFEERVRAQEAIERVYHSHTLGATQPFEEAVPREVLESKVRTYLGQSAALETLWATPVTGAMLRAELERMAKWTRMPERLRELYGALGRDPVLLRECLARPVLVQRLSRERFAWDPRIHAAVRAEAEDLRRRLETGQLDPLEARADRFERVLTVREPDVSEGAFPLDEDAFRRVRDELDGIRGKPSAIREESDAFLIPVLLEERAGSMRVASYSVRKRSWSDWWAETAPGLSWESIRADESLSGPEPEPGPGRGLPCLPDDTWDSGSLTIEPERRYGHSMVWTGSRAIVWGGRNEVRAHSSGGLYDPATDSWTFTTLDGAPEARWEHTAVWTGDRMVVWGGNNGSYPGPAYLNTGGRYDPQTDTWSPTSTEGAPAGRDSHRAVWTGDVMVIWGGAAYPNYWIAGGRYDPQTDTWSSTSTANAPEGRTNFTAVWTGTRMIVWGGEQNIFPRFDTGGRYDPVADSWQPTSTVGAPIARYSHTAVWTGDRMVVWGGYTAEYPGPPDANTGGRYDPATDTWSPTTTVGAPQGRRGHDAVWTGSSMVVWGGANENQGLLTAGGVYEPASDSWTATTTDGAPAGRLEPVAVWTGEEMVVWGGIVHGGRPLSSGGVYDPAVDRWRPTGNAGAPERRIEHTAVWTGTHMIVWGGRGVLEDFGDGGRYDPALDAWSPVSTVGAPSPRLWHTAVWTGSRMVVWGGGTGTAGVDTGGRYDPVADSWSPTALLAAPPPRHRHTAVWTGDRMIVWGGKDGVSYPVLGGAYDPVWDAWSEVTSAGAPTGRIEHAAAWAAGRMVVWGGFDGTEHVRTGGRFDPATGEWSSLTTSLAPAPRGRHTAVAWGNRVIVWGGIWGSSYLKNGGVYHVVDDSWTTTQFTDAPSPRADHTAVLAGDRMIVWGGQGGTLFLDTGGIYDPVGNTWLPTSTVNAASPRAGHTAAWTGSQMIVWGGTDDLGPADGGGLYARGMSADDDGDGYSECAGDCNDGNASIHPGADDPCNGLDDDCDGAADEDYPAPGEVEGLEFLDHTTMTWAPDPVADRYDTARGDLGALRDGSGDFTAALVSCLEEDGPDAVSQDATEPDPGSCFFYLVRAQNSCRAGTYDGAGSRQVDFRDRTLLACP